MDKFSQPSHRQLPAERHTRVTIYFKDLAWSPSGYASSSFGPHPYPGVGMNLTYHLRETISDVTVHIEKAWVSSHPDTGNRRAIRNRGSLTDSMCLGEKPCVERGWSQWL